MSAALLGHAVSVAGLGCLGYAALRFRRNLRAEHWPTAEGRVVASRLDEERYTDDDGQSHTRYLARITYEYSVAGERFEGHRIHPRDEGFVFQTEAEDALARRPVGAAVKVYYQPGDPSDALLEPDATAGAGNLLVLGAGLIATGQALASVLPRL